MQFFTFKTLYGLWLPHSKKVSSSISVWSLHSPHVCVSQGDSGWCGRGPHRLDGDENMPQSKNMHVHLIKDN